MTVSVKSLLVCIITSVYLNAVPAFAVNGIKEKPILFAEEQNTHCLKQRCGTKPYPSNTGNKTPDPILISPQVWNFVSEPALHPMKITVNRFDPGVSAGLVFLAPYGFSNQAMYGQPGALILDNEGNPIWFRPLNTPNLMNLDFRMQFYRDKPVLTFWQGTLATSPTYTNVPGGSSEPGSCYYILDNSYKVIKTLHAHCNYTSDIHEFLITPENTALFFSTKAIPMDLTPYGGPKDGYVQNFAIQEVDIKTNKLLFFWSALDHIPLTDSFEPASSASSSGNIWDAYHLNSIGLTNDPNDILVSSRHTWTIYRINKPTKTILWELGGKHSDFTISNEAQFSWQHDAHFLSNHQISLYDDNSNGSSTPTTPSHGLILQLDFTDMTASLYRSYYHDPNISASSQGNVQTLDNGNKFVGWGESQYYSEFAQSGNTESNPSLNLLYDAQMPSTNFTYRAYRNNWLGTPFYPPSIGIRSENDFITVYTSWNGSTETVQWQVYAGKKRSKLYLVQSAVKSGFETAIQVRNKGPYFQIKALDKNGMAIGKSKIVKFSD